MHKRLLLFLSFIYMTLSMAGRTIYDAPKVNISDLFSVERARYVICSNHVFSDTLFIPFGCELRFKGGSLSGPIVFDNTKLSGDVNLKGSSIKGKIKNKTFYASWLCYIDGKRDDARSINDLINLCDNIYFPEGKYLLRTEYNPNGIIDEGYESKIKTHIGINKSHVSLIGEKGATFVTDDALCTICIFSRPRQIEKSIHDIKIVGFTFEVHNDGKNFHEFIHTIKLIGVNKLTIEKCTFYDFWGDAISLSHYGDGPETGERTLNQNVKIIDNTILGGTHYNNRNGISVISGKNVLIRGNYIKDTSRNDMPGGIDVEPNNSAYTIENIRIKNNILEGIKGGGGAICVVAQKGGPAHNIYITGNRVFKSNTGLFIYLKTDFTTDNYIIRKNTIESDTRPYRFEGNGVSQYWRVTRNSFMGASKQPFLGDMTVKGLVMKNNVINYLPNEF